MVSLTEVSLWGDEYDTSEDDIKDLIKRSKPKQVKVYTEQSIKSKTVPILEKLNIIRANVLRILGVYKDNTLVIKTKEQLHKYIDCALSNGVIAIDTETNNSLDPISCILMGPCIYTPGQKNAYIPLNHINPTTRERLPWQLTEQDIKEEFQRINDSKTEIVMHNGKFDYQVIKCTCGLELRVDWDTLIAARLLNENERAGLKEQYISKIDPSIEKYSIEHLFEGVEYAVVDPEIFALYAATDSFMTLKLKDWQAEQFALDTNKRIYNLFKTVEMPVVIVTASMELAGVEIDTEYAKRLSAKYHKKLDALDEKIANELSTFSDKIAQWRATPEANVKPKTAQGKIGKSKNEQLSDPISITSNTQLAILIYDILGLESVDKKMPRGTGEDILVKLNEKHHIPLFQLILDKRGLEKLIGTYIDKLPECVSPVDNRLHAHFNQYGAATGRFSSSDPNLQNIPSHEKSIRMLFSAATPEHTVEENNNTYTVPYTDEVLTDKGWVKVKSVTVGDIICGDDSEDIITNIFIDDNNN